MPIYEYQCTKCDEKFEEYLSMSTNPAPPCPNCGAKKVDRLWSSINTEWLPSAINWHRVGSSWD